MATPTKLDACNMALALCGTRVGFLETLSDDTAEAQICNMHLDDAIRETLMEFPWPHSLRMVTWNDDALRTTLTGEAYNYKYDAATVTNALGTPDYTGVEPGSFLDFVEFVDPEKVRHTYRKIDYARNGDFVKTGHGGTTLEGNGNAVSGVVLILNDGTVAPGWDAHFAYACALNLAVKICGPLGAGQLRPFLMDAYSKALAEAIRNAGNSQENVLPPPDSEFITERQG